MLGEAGVCVSIGEKIRDLRIQRGMSQVDLADDLVKPSMISQIESGKVKPSYTLLIELAKRLGEPVETFLSELDPHFLLQANIRLAQYELATGRPQVARQLIENLPRASLQTRNLAEYRLTLARVHRACGEYPEAVRELEQLREHAYSAQDWRLLFYVLRETGQAEYDRGNLEGALGEWREAVALADRMEGKSGISPLEWTQSLIELHLHLDALDPGGKGFSVPWQRPTSALLPALATPPEVAGPPEISLEENDVIGDFTAEKRPYLAKAQAFAQRMPTLWAVSERLAQEALALMPIDPATARRWAEQANALVTYAQLIESSLAVRTRTQEAAEPNHEHNNFSTNDLQTIEQTAFAMTALHPRSRLHEACKQIRECLQREEVAKAAELIEEVKALLALTEEPDSPSNRDIALELNLLEIELAALSGQREASLQRLVQYEAEYPNWGNPEHRRRACALLTMWYGDVGDVDRVLAYCRKMEELTEGARPSLPFWS
ncbi:DNA-binding transcriptional regulator, XRE-family HTH domain [Alicyclobacillus hesperidum]|uniref:DNA-binding transcriptional regulator, XRE-family HTH domain n=1 Tax=Alicyclobacillus hesperidum TaxID=89784 RepID=A0A1H2WIJ7_9BACL|nr:DNA-binding transcriptional regulator, XRE-family HTH domain [Alicyclobacillus hesperidum]